MDIKVEKVPRHSAENLLVYWLPAILLYAVIAWGLWHTPNALFGMYANDDGMWAEWNTVGILQWGRFLDLNPFDPLSGMGSMFLPNLLCAHPRTSACFLSTARNRIIISAARSNLQL